MTSTLINTLLVVLGLLLAPFVIKGLFDPRTPLGRAVAILGGVLLVGALTAIWAYTGREATQIVYCWFDSNAPSCSVVREAVVQTSPVQPSTAPQPDPKTIELTYWQSVANSRDVEPYQQYLKKYPNGEFAGLARARINDIRERKAAEERRQHTSAEPTSTQPAQPPQSAPTQSAPPAGQKCVTFNGQLICN
jgi:hypothetical protein